MKYSIRLNNGEDISNSDIDTIGEKILDIIKPYKLSLPAVEYILDVTKTKASRIAIIK